MKEIQKLLIENSIKATISQVVLLKFGSIRLSPYDIEKCSTVEELQQSANKAIVQYNELEKNVKKTQTDVIDAIKGHPNIFAVRKVYSDQLAAIVRSINGFFILGGDSYLVDVKLPKMQYTYKDQINENTPCIEDFKVITNGSSFVAACLFDEKLDMLFFAHEFREIIRTKVNEKTKLVSNTMGPCPIHPDVYIVQCRKGTCENFTVLTKSDDVYIIINDKIQMDRCIELLYRAAQLSITRFYTLMNSKVLLMYYEIDINQLFQNAIDYIEHLYTSTWWKYLPMFKITSKAKQVLIRTFSKYLKYQERYTDHLEEQTDFINMVNEDKYFYNIGKYFKTHSTFTPTIPSTFIDAVKYFQSEIISFLHFRMIVLASIMGAVIGASLALIIKK